MCCEILRMRGGSWQCEAMYSIPVPVQFEKGKTSKREGKKGKSDDEPRFFIRMVAYCNR